MTDYSKHKKEKQIWWSLPFYSGPGGYKFCIVVDEAYRDKLTVEATDTYISMFLYLMKGENDDRLQWPFQGTVTILLLNHNSDQYAHRRKVKFSGTEISAQRVTSKDQYSKNGWGSRNYISHNKVESITSTRQYLKNDTLTFVVAEISVQTDSV